jgi:uncharacterized protein
MEIVSVTQTGKKIDTNLLVFTQLSQLLTYVTGFGGFVVPLILWLVKKDEIEGMDAHGKYIINFQITMLLVAIISIPGILLLGLGILSLIFVGILSFVMPIVNAVRASKGEQPNQFCTIRFIS